MTQTRYDVMDLSEEDPRVKFLGKTIRDEVTGLTGTCTQIAEMFNGNVQCAIQPKSKDGTEFPEAKLTDASFVEVVDVGLSERIPELKTSIFRVGDKVKDKVLGIEATVVERGYFMDGCCYVTVLTTNKDKDLKGTSTFQHEERFDLVKADNVKRSVLEAGIKPPGGPSRSAMKVDR
jgi:hypothetical protein